MCESWIEAAESAEKDKKWLISGILFYKSEFFDEGFKVIEKTSDSLIIMSALLISWEYMSGNYAT